jgi:hypothetical protein
MLDVRRRDAGVPERGRRVRLVGGHFDYRVGECLRGFLGHVVADPGQGLVGVLAGKPRSVRGAVGGRAVEVRADGDRGYRDRRLFGQRLLELFVLALPVGETQAPAVVMDDDVDVIRVVEGGGRTTSPVRLAGVAAFGWPRGSR